MNTNIIKVRAAPAAAPIASIKKEEHEASRKAQVILEDAEKRALQIVEDAERRKQAILEDAAKQGYASGLDKWNDTLTQAWKLREQFLARNEADLVKLSVAVAAKVIGREVQSDPSLIMRTVREALKSVRREKSLMIQVNPDEEPVVREQADSLRTLLPGLRDLAIVGNAAIAAGGCIVESEVGIIDAQIQTQLASLEKALIRRCDADSR
jgi:type III secretion protein L